jgi:hypothetical protein
VLYFDKIYINGGGSPPPAPTPIAPPNGGTVNTLTPTLQVQAISGADAYHFVVMDDGENPIVEWTTSQTSWTVASGYLGWETWYRWKCQAHNSVGWSDYFSPSWRFFTHQSGGGTDSLGMGASAWSYTGLSKISFYNYQTTYWDLISTWGPAQTWNWYRYPAAATSPYKDPSGPYGGVAYTCSGSSDTFKIAYVDFWWKPSGGNWDYSRINGTDYDQVSGNYRTEGTTLVLWGIWNGIPSEALYFDQFPVGISEGASIPPVKHGLTVSCSPNPGNGRAAISYNLTRESRVRLVLYDRAGRSVRQLSDGRQRPGSHTVACDLTGLASGIYVCRLEAEGRSASTAIVKSE